MSTRDERIALLAEDVERNKRHAVLFTSFIRAQEQYLSRGVEHLNHLKEQLRGAEERMQQSQFELDKLQLEESLPSESPDGNSQNPT